MKKIRGIRLTAISELESGTFNERMADAADGTAN